MAATVTTAYAQIAQSADATVTVRVRIVWPTGVPAAYTNLADLVVSSVKPVRSTATNLPAQSRYVAGVSAATCALTLAGLVDRTDDTKTIGWLMGRRSTTSPLYRRSCLGAGVTVDYGILTGTTDPSVQVVPAMAGVEEHRAFTGFIDDYTEHADGTVDVTCIDGRTRFRTVPQLPPAYRTGTYMDLNGVKGGTPDASLLTGLYAVNYLLHTNGFPQSPPHRPSCLLWQSNHGGSYPELTAAGDVRQAGSATWVPGVFSPQVPATSTTFLVPIAAGAPKPLLPVGTATLRKGVFWQAWVRNDGAPNVFASQVLASTATGSGLEWDGISSSTGLIGQSVRFNPGNGQPFTTLNAPASASIPADGAWHYVACSMRASGGTVSATFWLDAAAYATSLTLAGADGGDIVQVNTGFYVPVDSIQVTGEAYGAASGYGFTPAPATLDPSLNALTAIPDTTGAADAWAVLQDVAEAEQGIIGLDELGVPFFKNGQHTTATPSVRTLPFKMLAGCDIDTAQVGLVNRVQVPVNKLRVGPYTWVWQAADTITVPAYAQFRQTITTDHAVVDVSRYDLGRRSVSQIPDGHTWWRACQAIDGNGPEVVLMFITCTQLSPTSVALAITNPHAFPVYMVTPVGVGYPQADEGQPCVVLGGRQILTDASTGAAATGASASVVAESAFPDLRDGGPAATPSGEQLLTLPANVWRQNLAQAQQLSDGLLAELSVPKPVLSNVRLPIADLSLQRADRVTVGAESGLSADADDAILSDLTINDDWTMDLIMRLVGMPGGWMLNQPGRSELNTTVYL